MEEKDFTTQKIEQLKSKVPTKNHYTSKDILQIFGIKKDTLKEWEKANKIPKARRNTQNWRVYTPEELDIVLKTVLNEGLI